MIDIENKISKIDNLNVKNISEKKMSLENLIKTFKNEKNDNDKIQLLFLIHYFIDKYNEFKYFYKFDINYNKSTEKINDFFS